ncbi:TPA: ParB-like nuclease domain-containing protein [Kluyvera ascorbata]|uniref:ParB-like nuclease domain-containing protein n=1 Tax=Kluyvera genomosp. 3 TaxID=2774055 RepID=A0A6G9RNA2_9ENTR|nr:MULTISPECIES: ParB/RepB/Spo0J family partition protein [Kluyvera]QIR28426.1 ParB-like nuclease domain-containing protein [Kluyvera genomosp. 3]UAK22538.1 ParB/RepB/Spo0J family partition protein [Kluyvera sp. CRP]HCR3981659.1 ParB-like nuclease domain-containing protein [Kluyvera ascorbata]HDT6544146.1 ParB-like nuclease domain-containing protein [Kluyvera ascorbata]
MRQTLINQLHDYLQSLAPDDKIDAINQFRQALHAESPFKDQPIDCVLWVKEEQITPNDYNPNNMAPQEKRLLTKSLEADGFTQPIVVVEKKDRHYEIVDGFHRHQLSQSKATLKKRFHGYLPITQLEKCDDSLPSRMAATVRHNRARGRHQISAMSDIVRELSQLGWSDEKMGQELGMDADEILRLKQINGLCEMFGNRQFSQAWTVK